MTILPSQIYTLTADDLILKGKLEAAIDAELLLKGEADHTIVVRHSIIFDASNANPRVLNAVIAGYENRGWRVVRYENDDQGYWLSFSEV